MENAPVHPVYTNYHAHKLLGLTYTLADNRTRGGASRWGHLREEVSSQPIPFNPLIPKLYYFKSRKEKMSISIFIFISISVYFMDPKKRLYTYIIRILTWGFHGLS